MIVNVPSKRSHAGIGLRLSKLLPVVWISLSACGLAPAQAPGPGISMNSDGRLEVAFRNGDCSASHSWQATAASEYWIGDLSWGGCVDSAPVLISNEDGRLETFASASGAIYRNYQVSPNSAWSGWIRLAGLDSVTERPVVVHAPSGVLEIFALQNNVIYESKQTTASDDNSWTAWSPISPSQFLHTPTALLDPRGLMFLFTEGVDGAAWVNSEADSEGAWTGWTSLGGGIMGSPVAAIDARGYIQVFARDGTPNAGLIYRNSQQLDGSWSGWTKLGSTLIQRTPSVGINSDGRLELFGVGSDGAGYHIWQGTPGDNNSWVDWSPYGGYLTSDISVSRNIDGRLAIFGTGGDGVTVYRNYQVAAGSGWSGWLAVGDSSGPAVSSTRANYAFGVHGELLMGGENDAVLNFSSSVDSDSGTSYATQLMGHWPCAVVSVSIDPGFGKSFKAVQRAISNWNKALARRYNSQPPVLFVIGNVPQSPYSLTIRRTPSVVLVGKDPSPVSTYWQGYTHNYSAPQDSTGALTGHVDIDINARITVSATITNTVAHEIGHTFDLGHCEGCANTSSVMAHTTITNPPESRQKACASAQDSPECITATVNIPQGTAGPRQVDLNLIAQSDQLLATCQGQQASNSAPTCNDGSTATPVQTYASNGEPTDQAYACDGNVCDSCNSSCNSFSQQKCSGDAQSIGQTCVSGYCGSTCLDDYDCSYCGGNGFRECYAGQATCGCSPIAIDAFGAGFHFTDLSNGVKFKVTSSIPALQMSWPSAASRNGWLVLDRNGNGVIDDFTELFGNISPQPFSSEPNGYAALAVFDDPANGGNGNNVIDPFDSVYSRLRLWIDSNHNGVSEAGELHQLPEVGIFGIDLRYSSSPYVDAYGNQFRYRSIVLDLAGPSHASCYDVFVRVEARKK